MNPIRSIAAAALIAANAPAQAPDARTFLPAEHTAYLDVDIDGLVEAGLWDAVERSILRLPLAAFHASFGFDLADCDRIQFAQRIDPAPDGTPQERWPRDVVWAFEGSDRVSAARLGDEVTADCQRTQVAEVDVHRRTIAYLDGTAMTFEIAAPRPGLLVSGRSSALRDASRSPVSATLAGEHEGGVPAAALLPLTASPHALAMFASAGTASVPIDPSMLMPFPPHWCSPEHPLDGFRCQLRRKPKTDALVLELLLRYRDEAGARQMAKAYDDTLADLAADQHTAAFAQLLKPVTKTVASEDVTLALHLGTGRDAVAEFSRLLGTLAPVMLVTARVSDPVEAAAVAAPVAPEPVPAKLDPGKRDR